MNVLVFAPHPDDDVIGCGGSLAKHVNAGSNVSICYLTSGDSGVRDANRERAAGVREVEATKAAAELGVQDLHFLREPDGFLGESASLVVRLVNLIRQVRPEIAYLPHAADDHTDHIAGHRVVMKALRRASGPWLPEADGEEWATSTILGYEVWTPIQRPTYFEDTTDVFEQQLSALTRHESQVIDVPYADMLRGLAAFRGSRLGSSRKAEAFEVLRLPSSSLTG
jgi:LmbE family N-acetylglucosaminyl deacetylase